MPRPPRHRHPAVIPAKAGIQYGVADMHGNSERDGASVVDPGLRRGDGVCRRPGLRMAGHSGGRVGGLSAFIFAAFLAAAPAHAANRALLIGIDDYAEARLDIPAPGSGLRDVEAMRRLLTARLGYRDAEIRTLIDEAATRGAILEAFQQWLVQGSARGDRVMLYFAGHGYFAADADRDEADGLDEGFVPHDAAIGTEPGSLLIDGLVLDDDIARLIAALPGRSVTVVADAGFSGQVSRTGAAGSAPARSPRVAGATRAIVVEPKAQAQKAEGAFIDAMPAGAEAAVWTAVSASQSPLIDPENPQGAGGVFTKAFVDGLMGRADKTGNGNVSNAELLAHLTETSQGYCGRHADQCEMGLTPRLDPASALGAPALGAPAGKAEAKLTAPALMDFLAKGNTTGVALRQVPPSPVLVGAKDIRFEIVSPHDGFLILLNLTDAGELYQLYPNEFSRTREREGKLRGGAPIRVPDDYYGLRFDATAPTSGQIVAVVSRRKVDWDNAVGTRAIAVIPRQEAVQSFLPKIAATLGAPVGQDRPEANTEPMEWSVATLRYEIKPKP